VSAVEGLRTIPSWALVTRRDHAIAVDVQRFMAKRAEARITGVDASHAVMRSRPDAVAAVIAQAAC
jgi:pimeloyl-ACP methyl ester carboxylesterase